MTGDFARVIDLSEQALARYREIGDRHGMANALLALGRVKQTTDDPAAADELMEQALELFTELGDRMGEAVLYRRMGTWETERAQAHLARLRRLKSTADT